MSQLYSNSIFWIEVDKINPNPYQPRREFNEEAMKDLADSIRQYGVLQPLVVSRVEREKEDGGLTPEYELIAGERRLRGARLAGLREVPVVIRVGDDNRMKLELAIIENLQREDLNAVDRARAFLKLNTEFGFSHTDIAKKMGKSREYVSNTLRLLQLPQDVLDALSAGKISEGHTRPIMMLNERPEEQQVLFKEILYKKITVREAERIARKIATDKVRKKELIQDPHVSEIEKKLQDALGTRVHIERKENGGYITIDFFSTEDLETILDHINTTESNPNALLERYIQKQEMPVVQPGELVPHIENSQELPVLQSPEIDVSNDIDTEMSLLDDRSKDEVAKSEQDTDLYNLSKFSL